MKHEPSHKSSLAPLLRWLTGDATRHDERALDAQAQDDPFLADAIEGYRSMPEADHTADVTRLKARLRQKTEPRRGAGFYLLRVAAVGAVLVGAWVVFQQFGANKEAAVAEATPPTTTDAADMVQLADSVETGQTTATPASPTTDDRVAVQDAVSPKAKNATPQPTAPADNERYDYAVESKDAPAPSSVPEPEALKDSQAAPAAEVAVESDKPEMLKQDAEVSKSKAKAKKQYESSAKPAPTPIRTITGKVTDENGEPLIGASVLVVGTNSGTVTDVDGTYSLGLPAGSKSLAFNFMGYSPMQVNLGMGNELDVSMNSNEASLSEVVVVAEGALDEVQSPRPVDGFRAYKKYVADKLRHPEADKQPRPRQVVRVKFTLQANGSLANFTAKGDAPQAYKDEAIRLLREGPRWKGTAGTTASFRFVFE